MSATTSIELNPQQREILLEGLRYVRSSIALEMNDWSPQVEAERDRRYQQVQQIEALLTGSRKEEAARV